LHARQRARAGAAVVARDLDGVGVPLRHPGRDGADTGRGHQLDADAGARVHALQVVDELREVFDRVDVVVRGRADERHAGHGVTDGGDLGADLEAGDLPAFPRLRALRHLDLDLPGAGQVGGRHPEAAGRDLFDGAVRHVAALRVPAFRQAALGHVAVERREADRVLAAFAGVALRA